MPGQGVPHRARPTHEASLPVHVVLRRVEELPSLRTEAIHDALRDSVHETQLDGFRITQYAVRPDQVHLIVEGDDATTLAAGLKGFGVRAARRLNRVVGRSGTVWAERHHRRELESPHEVRDTLSYLSPHEVPTSERPPLAAPQTWLLREGWRHDALPDDFRIEGRAAGD